MISTSARQPSALAPRASCARYGDRAATARVALPISVSSLASSTAPSSDEQIVAVGDRLGRRRFEERKVLDLAQVQRLHAQDHARRATNARFPGRCRPAAPGKSSSPYSRMHTPGRDAAATPGALVGRRLRDRLHLQLLDLVAVTVALDARQPGIDDVADARHGERGFGDVRREHDAPPRSTAGTRAPAPPPKAVRTAAGFRYAAGWCLRNASAASRISRSPGRNTSTSPGPLRATSSTASTMASQVRAHRSAAGLDRILRRRAAAGARRLSAPRRGSAPRPDTAGPTLRSPAPACRRCRNAARSAPRRSSPRSRSASGRAACGSSCFR